MKYFTTKLDYLIFYLVSAFLLLIFVIPSLPWYGPMENRVFRLIEILSVLFPLVYLLLPFFKAKSLLSLPVKGWSFLPAGLLLLSKLIDIGLAESGFEMSRLVELFSYPILLFFFLGLVLHFIFSEPVLMEKKMLTREEMVLFFYATGLILCLALAVFRYQEMNKFDPRIKETVFKLNQKYNEYIKTAKGFEIEQIHLDLSHIVEIDESLGIRFISAKDIQKQIEKAETKEEAKVRLGQMMLIATQKILSLNQLPAKNKQFQKWFELLTLIGLSLWGVYLLALWSKKLIVEFTRLNKWSFVFPLPFLIWFFFLPNLKFVSGTLIFLLLVCSCILWWCQSTHPSFKALYRFFEDLLLIGYRYGQKIDSYLNQTIDVKKTDNIAIPLLNSFIKMGLYSLFYLLTLFATLLPIFFMVFWSVQSLHSVPLLFEQYKWMKLFTLHHYFDLHLVFLIFIWPFIFLISSSLLWFLIAPVVEFFLLVVKIFFIVYLGLKQYSQSS